MNVDAAPRDAEPGVDDITELLQRWRGGDPRALEQLVPLVYRELRQLAQHLMLRERPEHTLEATALVHEAYLRLCGKDHPRWEDRAHFFAVAAQAMRRVLIDHARRLKFAKRGGGQAPLSLDETATLSASTAREFVALDDALNALEGVDPALRQIVELRFFGGLTIPDVAHYLGLSPATVKREWRTAKAWLYAEMSSGAER